MKCDNSDDYNKLQQALDDKPSKSIKTIRSGIRKTYDCTCSDSISNLYDNNTYLDLLFTSFEFGTDSLMQKTIFGYYSRPLSNIYANAKSLYQKSIGPERCCTYEM